MSLRVRVGEALSIYAGTARALGIKARARILQSVFVTLAVCGVGADCWYGVSAGYLNLYLHALLFVLLYARRNVLSCRAFSFVGGYQFLLLKHTNMKTNTCTPANAAKVHFGSKLFLHQFYVVFFNIKLSLRNINYLLIYLWEPCSTCHALYLKIGNYFLHLFELFPFYDLCFTVCFCFCALQIYYVSFYKFR